MYAVDRTGGSGPTSSTDTQTRLVVVVVALALALVLLVGTGTVLENHGACRPDMVLLALAVLHMPLGGCHYASVVVI